MTATEYTIEIAISLEQNSELNLIELARRVYKRRGAATLPNRKRKPIRSDESIDGPETALIELAGSQPAVCASRRPLEKSRLRSVERGTLLAKASPKEITGTRHLLSLGVPESPALRESSKVRSVGWHRRRSVGVLSPFMRSKIRFRGASNGLQAN